MWGIGTWLAKQDQFGGWAKFNYRGESGFGTGWGGCFSLLLTIATFFFVSIQLLAFTFYPAYNQQSTVTYL